MFRRGLVGPSCLATQPTSCSSAPTRPFQSFAHDDCRTSAEPSSLASPRLLPLRKKGCFGLDPSISFTRSLAHGPGPLPNKFGLHQGGGVSKPGTEHRLRDSLSRDISSPFWYLLPVNQFSLCNLTLLPTDCTFFGHGSCTLKPASQLRPRRRLFILRHDHLVAAHLSF